MNYRLGENDAQTPVAIRLLVIDFNIHKQRCLQVNRLFREQYIAWQYLHGVILLSHVFTAITHG